MSWLFRRLVGWFKLVLLVAAVGGPALAYLSWTDTQRIRDIESSGVETEAVIESAKQKTRKRSTSYTLLLAWRDGQGQVRKADDVSISSAFAKKIIADNRVMRASVRIKYLASSSDVAPIILEDAAEQEATNAMMVRFGAIAGVLGLIGAALMFWLGRRRRAADARLPA